MRVAVLISGYLRSFKENINKIEKIIIKKFNNVDFYIHITKNEEKYDKYLNPSNIYEDIKTIESKLNPVCLLVEDNIEKDNFSIINNWLKFFKLNEIKKLNEKNKGKYDLVIKYRPDLDIISEDLFNIKINKQKIYIPKDSKIDKNKLKNLEDKYICDIFSFGTSSVMNKYFNIYKNLPKLIKKYGNISETILYYYLEDNNIKYDLIDVNYQVILSKCNVFAICGDSGSGKTTFGNILKKFFSNSFLLECDRYHKWERGDKNWEKYTHLNPEANYISKMNEDIFNLKVGNSIYQVDYDHKYGKFTEKELINPSENTIVCGLHSLYHTNDHLYDLKIFMDTDNFLKKEWKINRDVKERGYSIEKILNQIEKREEDYEKFIYPQREKSDLIINFFHNDKNEISLKLSINQKFNIKNIIKKMNDKNIIISNTINENNFFSLIFYEYKEINFLWENNKTPQFNNFYDYILYAIMNLY